MFQPSILLGQDHWEINIPLPLQRTEAAAMELAVRKCGSSRLCIFEGVPAIELLVNGVPTLFFDDSIVIKEVSEAKRATMAPSLDITAPTEAAEAIRSFMSGDESRTIFPEDMVASEKNLAWFLAQYGVGYRLDSIAYGVLPVQ
jgi:hypothetical protein